MKDHYEILDVPRDASQEEIKAAYRRLALRCHPDRHPGDPIAEERFKQATRAYRVLRDARSRNLYDARRTGFSAAPMDMAEAVATFIREFGGGSVADSGGEGGAPEELVVRVRLEDLLHGTRKRASDPRITDGTDLDGPAVDVPAGAPEGLRIPLPGNGSGGVPTVAVVVVEPHPVFDRRGAHLVVDLPVSFARAALGATVRVPTLEGTEPLVLPPGTQSEHVLRLRGHGLPYPDGRGRGDILVRVKVEVPTRLDRQQRSLLQQLETDGVSAQSRPTGEAAAFGAVLFLAAAAAIFLLLFGFTTPPTAEDAAQGEMGAELALAEGSAPGPSSTGEAAADLPAAASRDRSAAADLESAPVSLPSPPGDGELVALAAATCVLEGGRPACWGDPPGPSPHGAGAQDQREAWPRLRGVEAGLVHACGLTGAGEVHCWGENLQGQVGAEDGDRGGPVRLALASPAVRLAAGAAHTCALTLDGSVHCWGANANGQLGDGSDTDRFAPAPAAARGPFRTLTAGWLHTCALDARGATYCWGRNGAGQLGDGTTVDRREPVRAGSERFATLAAGAAHTCGLTPSGSVRCWGDNRRGQVGADDAGPGAVAKPTQVRLRGRVRSLVAGAAHTCVLTVDDRAWCWGANDHGQLGDGTRANAASPRPVAGDLRFRRLVAGPGHTCGRATTGRVYCWGLNMDGQLGDGTRWSRPAPVPVGGGA